MELNTIKAPARIYIAFAIAVYVWHTAAAMLGVFIADRLGISDADPELKSDLKKMALCSLIALSLFFSLFYFAQSPVVFMVYIICFLFSLKIAYLGANHGFLLIILGSTMAGMIVLVPVISWLRLPGIFSLYLLFFIALLLRRLKNKRQAQENKKREQLQEQHIRSLAGRNPEFTTFCYQCLFYHPDIARCQLRLDGKKVRDIIINQRTFCTSFQRNRTDDLRIKE
jgi:hypothetical protein